jgi:nicotinamidase/pyrazinamidase
MNVLRKPRALVVVDVQNDFVDGTLAVSGAETVPAAISRAIADNPDMWDVIVATADWHTEHTEGHFAPEGEQPDYANTWPVHCMADTRGAALHDDLDLPAGTPVFRKGQTDASYSGFDGTTADGETLADYLHARGVVAIDVAGLAFDFCVAATAVDGADAGFKVRVLKPLTASVSDETERAAMVRLVLAGVFTTGYATI